MRILEKHAFGEITAYELGWAPVGRPLMTVHLYMVGGLLIDTGQKHMRKEVLELVKVRRCEKVLLTHHHEDHSGNAGAIQRALDMEVFGHPLTVQEMEKPFKILPYQRYTWGKADPLVMKPLPESVKTNSIRLAPIHTPGHSKDHVAYLEADRGWLFSGDLYLADRIKYFRADESIKDQIDSLRMVLTLDFDSLFCCHRPRLKEGKKHISRKLRFLEEIYGNVAALSGEGLGEKEIMRKLNLKEARLVRLICFGNVSMRNMVRSVLKSLAVKKSGNG